MNYQQKITQNIFNLRNLFLFLTLCVCCAFVITSCKTANESLSETKSGDTISITENDLNESNEDLLAVDYKQFYDELAPYGEWIEVNSDDMGVEIKPSSSNRHYKEDELPKISIAALLGVKDAYADLSVSTFFIWKPSANLAVGVAAVESQVQPTPAYVPYTNGEWVATNEGWYFKAPTPYEETVHHYGRWMNSSSLGWIWVPGRVRSPAWVNWREDDEYVAWTPISPSVYIVNNVIPEPQVEIVENNYVIVEKKYFVEPQVYRYFYPQHRVKIKGMKHINGIVVRDRVIYDSGPDVVVIEKYANRKIVPVQVTTVNNINQIVYSGNEMKVYSPTFKKIKVKNERFVPITKPQKFEKHKDIVERIHKNKNQSASDFNPNDNKSNGKEDKKSNREWNKKLADDKDMRIGKNKFENIQREKKDVIKDKVPKEDRKQDRRDNKKEKVKDRKNNDDNKRDDKVREKNKERGKDKKK